MYFPWTWTTNSSPAPCSTATLGEPRIGAKAYAFSGCVPLGCIPCLYPTLAPAFGRCRVPPCLARELHFRCGRRSSLMWRPASTCRRSTRASWRKGASTLQNRRSAVPAGAPTMTSCARQHDSCTGPAGAYVSLSMPLTDHTQHGPSRSAIEHARALPSRQQHFSQTTGR